MKNPRIVLIFCIVLISSVLFGCSPQTPENEIPPSRLRESNDPFLNDDAPVLNTEQTEIDIPLDDDAIDFVEGEGPKPDIVERIDFENEIVYTRFAAFAYQPKKLIGLAESLFTTESYPDSETPYEELEDFFLSKDVVELTLEHASVNVDAIGKLPNGLYGNLSLFAFWESEEPDVAVAYAGSITGITEGETIVHVVYDNYVRDIQVTVTP